MLGIYLLVTLFSQFSFANAFPFNGGLPVGPAAVKGVSLKGSSVNASSHGLSQHTVWSTLRAISVPDNAIHSNSIQSNSSGISTVGRPHLVADKPVTEKPFTEKLGDLSDTANVAKVPGEKVELDVVFERMEGITAGSPVIILGQQVGTVTAVKSQDGKSDSDKSSYIVSLEVTPKNGLDLLRGTVALQAALLTPSHGKPKAMVELFVPPANRNKPVQLAARGERIKGFNSCEDFWSAAQASSWN